MKEEEGEQLPVAEDEEGEGVRGGEGDRRRVTEGGGKGGGSDGKREGETR